MSSTTALRPSCSATGGNVPRPPDGIRTLLAAGYPAESLPYYRGCIHDWVMLGLPLEPLYTGDADVPERDAPVRR